MGPYHFSAGSIAALAAFCAGRYGFQISANEAGVIGAAAFSAGAGLIHLAKGPGILPAFKRALFGVKPVA